MATVTMDCRRSFLRCARRKSLAGDGAPRVHRRPVRDPELRSDPREDGYSSNGSDERMLARQYYDRVGYPYMHGGT